MKQELIQKLTENTQILLSIYLEKTELYAKESYNLAIIRRNWSEADYCKHFGIEPELYNPRSSTISFYGFPKGFYNTANARRYDNMKKSIYNTLRLTLEDYIKYELKKANEHYTNSIEKLAYRLLNKNLNSTNFSITNESIGVNINLTITDNDTGKITRCWTVVASGPVQQPHYRFLIK